MWVLGHENHRDFWKQSRGFMSPFVAYEEARFRSFSGLLNEALCAVPGMCCWGGMLGDTWGSAMGLRWKWVLLVTSTTGSCSWISKNICEWQHHWELNWRRKLTVVSSMKAVLLVTHGLSLNTRLDIKHFPAVLERGKKSNILNSWVYQVKHTTTSQMSHNHKILSDQMLPRFSTRWPRRQNMSSSCTITGAHSMVL